MKQIATTLHLVRIYIQVRRKQVTCPLDVFSDATNLSPEQQVQTVELAEMYKAYYRPRTFTANV